MTTPDVPDANRSGSLAPMAARGAVVTIVGQGLRIVLQLASIVVLARLLSPRDFGLVAGVLALVGIAEVLRDFGLSTAAIQARDLTATQRDALLWANTAIGAALALAVLLGSGGIAAVYDEPLLEPIAQVLGVSFLLNGLAAQYRVDLTRRLRFFRLVQVDVGAQAVGLAVGVSMALGGAGYWALVGQQLAQAAAALVLAVLVCRWLPGPPRRGAGVRSFLRFGGSVMLSQVLSYASKNVDNLLIGSRIGLNELGVYSRAYTLIMTPLGQLRAPSTTVALPVLARLQDDQARYDSYLRRGQAALGYTLVAGLAVAAGAAEPLVALALGDQWGRAVPLVTLLALAGAMETLPYVGYWVYLSRGLTGPLLRFTVLSTALKVGCIVIGSSFGTVGVAAGFLVGSALNWPLSLWRVSRVTPVALADLLWGASRMLLLALLALGASYLASEALDGSAAAWRLVAAVAAGLTSYALAAACSRLIRRDLRELLEVVSALRKRQAPRR